MNIFEKIRLAWKTAGAIQNVKEASMKAGWKTSEFWLVLLSQLGPVVMMLWGLIPANIMVQIMLVGGALTGIFAALRTYVKTTATKADDAMFNKMVESKVIVALKPILDKLGADTSCIPL
jgi:hypothetical protein